MAGYIGKLDAFDSGTDDWTMYCERMEQYFKANDIGNEKRVSVLLSAIGGKAYALLRSLTAPAKPADVSFDNIVKTMQDHLAPKPLLIAEQFRFHKRNQNEGESIAAYVAELKKLSEHCQFGDGLNDALRDRLVCGILQESIQKRLLTEADLTFKRAVEIAVAMETAARDAVELRSGVKMSVNKMFAQCFNQAWERPVPYAIRQKVEIELDRLEAEGILSKVDWSPWATPVVPVSKKDGSVRLCGDFKVSVNPELHVEQYPLPRIEDIFATLSGGRHFSKIDLAEAYLQMEMEEDSKVLLTINTHKGLYRYNRLVFGIASAPALWQRAMDQVLQGCPGTQCYLDDIIVTGENDSRHLENLARVLRRLEDFGLRARRDKCEFFKSSITYCGHHIDANGLHKCPDKLRAIAEAPPPKDVSQLRSFLGFVNYYNRFLPNLATVLHPLNALLQAGKKWMWTKQCTEAFREAKRLVMSDTVLTHFDPHKPLKVACDASPYGIGAVLSHVMSDGTERPIAFASRSLSAAEKNYAQIDREALSLVWGVKRFNQYLYGNEFTLVTDHQPLVSIFSPQKGVPLTAAARMQRWALFLGGHRYRIEFKRTHRHANADGLSRPPLDLTSTEPVKESISLDVFTLAQLEGSPVIAEMVQRETRRDPTLSQVYAATQNGWNAEAKSRFAQYYQRRDELALDGGCIIWGLRVVIPAKLRNRVLEELHVGHLGVVKMKSLARSFVWWPGIDQQIEQLAMHCSGCQHVQKMPKAAPLHPWEWPALPWQRIHVDFAGPFMGTTFLVVVDACSKWPEVFSMTSTTASQTVTVLRELFARTGVPEQLVSDNGPQFVSAEFQIFLKNNEIKHLTSAPYHPATNGLAERFVQSLKNALRAMTNEKMTLNQKLQNFLFAYRNAAHATTNRTPAMLFLGRPLRSRLDLLKPNLKRTIQDKELKQLQGGGKTRELEVGDNVLARDYRGDHKWMPARVKERTGPLSYTVEVAPDILWRRHIDQLRSSNVPLESVPVNVPSTPTVPATNGSETALPSDGTVTPCKAPQSPVPICEERRYSTRVRKPPNRLNL
ncbi:LOW QUALITY PROTEIN: uncharacterized protein K02A2.6-like [Pangasianodon hypophthalmus]|uniref:LOW QUALITY PROTEIN: uncharacterized protein K02A2.6-like n=1 Tax=Pangasianodon hypophthalmus TaxID=310915 RepID=UPI0023071673|nr:LOW QUALITY PROTEIN: uncharacterized protein K02A2.6-like [Pangasianodon hypophthalmus]